MLVRIRSFRRALHHWRKELMIWWSDWRLLDLIRSNFEWPEAILKWPEAILKWPEAILKWPEAIFILKWPDDIFEMTHSRLAKQGAAAARRWPTPCSSLAPLWVTSPSEQASLPPSRPPRGAGRGAPGPRGGRGAEASGKWRSKPEQGRGEVSASLWQKQEQLAQARRTGVIGGSQRSRDCCSRHDSSPILEQLACFDADDITGTEQLITCYVYFTLLSLCRHCSYSNSQLVKPCCWRVVDPIAISVLGGESQLLLSDPQRPITVSLRTN